MKELISTPNYLKSQLTNELNSFFNCKLVYYDRTNTINGLNSFNNYFGDSSIVFPSNRYSTKKLIIDRIYKLLSVLNNRKLIIIYPYTFLSTLVLLKMCEIPEIIKLKKEGCLKITRRPYVYNYFKVALNKIEDHLGKIETLPNKYELFNKQDTMYLIFGFQSNTTEGFNNFALNEQNYNLSVKESLTPFLLKELKPLIDKCPYYISNKYQLVFWLKTALLMNEWECRSFYGISNKKINLASIFNFFNTRKFLGKGFYDVINTNTKELYNKNNLKHLLISILADEPDFYKDPLIINIENNFIDKKMIYTDGAVE